MTSGYGERVAWQHSESTRCAVVGAAAPSTVVLWDDIGDGDIASGVGGKYDRPELPSMEYGPASRTNVLKWSMTRIVSYR